MHNLNKVKKPRFFIIQELIGSGFFIGYLPMAPGTWGSYSAACLLSILCGWFGLTLSIVSIIGCVICFVIGIPASQALLEASQKKDSSFIVIDEWAGMFITYSLVSFNLINILCGFVLFRIFDIFKPWPARTLENLKGGWGVMLDDIIAGIYAALALYLTQRFLIDFSS